MFITEYFVVYPEGDTQEVPGRLGLNQLVDVNGKALNIPLRTNKMVVFQVLKITTDEYKGGKAVYHHLEQLSARELQEYVVK